MTRLHTVLLVLLGLIHSVGCEQNDERATIEFTVDADRSLRQAITSLVVQAQSEDQEFETRKTFTGKQLEWPIELVVYVPQNRHDVDVVLVAVAKAGDRTVDEQTVSTSVRAGRSAGVTLGADVDAEREGGLPDAGARDSGTPKVPDAAADSGPAKMVLEAGVDGGADAQGADAQVTPATCDTDGAIRCDDGNACNGVEQCDSADPSADARGCVAGAAVRCQGQQTCDAKTGACSSCEKVPDADGDGEASMACGGSDCDDTVREIHPGAKDVCNGKDDDCSGRVDDLPQACSGSAPVDGTATCEAGACKPKCTDPNAQIVKGVCRKCPTPNPCAPGTCVPLEEGYKCDCPAGYRGGAGATLCMQTAAPKRTLTFEVDCSDKPLERTFVNEQSSMPGDTFAPCGVTIEGGDGAVSPVLYRPLLPVEGMEGTALVGGNSRTHLKFRFEPPVHSINFKVASVEETGLIADFKFERNQEGMPKTETILPFPSGSNWHRTGSLTGITELTLRNVSGSGDAFYVDDFLFARVGCGDSIVYHFGETCDVGPDNVQCDGCDNTCRPTVKGCLRARDNQCVAGAARADGTCAD